MLSELEKDALKEFVNIGFGRAAADLSALMNLEICLVVPEVEVLLPGELQGYLKKEAGAEDYSIIQQFFLGNFRGAAYLLLPFNGGKALLRLFGSYSEDLLTSYGMDALERETLLEISNILIGACISRVADVLKEPVSYSPPAFYRMKTEPFLPDDLMGDDTLIITIKTRLQFREIDVDGYMFILSDIRTATWLGESIRKFLEPYK